MKLKRVLSTALVLAMSTALLIGCGEKEEAKEEKKEETLKIGLCPEYPPFESVNESGEIEGFDADLAKAIGEEMGMEVEFVNTPWEGLIAGVNNGEFDLIMSAMSPEEATAATDAVALSDPYYELKDIIVVRKDDNSITKKEDLAGKIVGFQTGSAGEQGVEKLEGMGVEFGGKNPYNRNSDAFAELENGRIDAIVVSFPYAVTQAKEDDFFKVVNDAVQSCDLVVIAPQGEEELIEKYNEALKAVKESGKYAEIEGKWLSVE